MNITRFQSFAQDLINRNITDDQVVHMNGGQTDFSTVKWHSLRDRDKIFKDQNQAIRQALADNLRSTFGVTDLSKLPKSVLDVLKLDDFKLNKEGVVTSKRPLTARRLIAITGAVTNWLEACQEGIAKFEGRAIITHSPDAEQLTNDIQRLFDANRPLPANLRKSTLNLAASLMLGMQLKPVHARLALECVALIDAAGIKIPSFGSPAKKFNKIARQIGSLIGPKIKAFRGQAEIAAFQNYQFKQNNPGVPLPQTDLIKDGLKGQFDSNDTDSLLRMVTALLLKQNPSLARLSKEAKNVDYDELDVYTKAFDDADQAISNKEANLTNIENAAPENTPEKAAAKAKLEAMQIKHNINYFSQKIMYNLSVQASGIDILPQRIDKTNRNARPINEKTLPDTIARFKKAGNVKFSSDEMFVFNGKPGLKRCPPEIKGLFDNLDPAAYGPRVQKIANSNIQLTIVEEMAKGMAQEKMAKGMAQQEMPKDMAQQEMPEDMAQEKMQYEDDYFRTTLFLEGGDGSMPNKVDSPQQKQMMDDNFAVSLTRNTRAKYATLSDYEKAKVMLVKAMLHQKFETIAQTATIIAMSPNGDRRDINAIFVPLGSDLDIEPEKDEKKQKAAQEGVKDPQQGPDDGKGVKDAQQGPDNGKGVKDPKKEPDNGRDSIYKYSFDDDGGITATVYRSQVAGKTMDFGFNANDEENKSYEATDNIRETVRVDMHISPEEVDRFISQDWSKFNAGEVTNAYNSYHHNAKMPRIPDFYANFAHDHIPAEFQLKIDTSVLIQYEIKG